MSVYKQGSFYRYDFQLNGRRFFGTAETRNKKEAEAIEREARAKAKADIEQEKRTGSGPLTLDVAAGRYWKEKGEHLANSATTWTDLERLLAHFGKEKRMDQITDADVAALVAWRRGQQRWAAKKAKKKPDAKGAHSPKALQLISPATVNRSTTVLLKAIFTRARRTWRYTFPLEPNWRDHILKEPQERVRFLDTHEGTALTDKVRDDYADWFAFARLTGLRRNETLIRWDEVNIFAKRITTTGKGRKKVSTPITPAVQAILDRCKGQHPEYVFTYVCKRPLEGQKKGQRYPITPEGAKSQWRRLVKAAGVNDFRFHDIRHDVATRLLLNTGNLKLVQKALNHSNIATTVKYSHVMDDQLADALQALASPTKTPTMPEQKAS